MKEPASSKKRRMGASLLQQEAEGKFAILCEESCGATSRCTLIFIGVSIVTLLATKAGKAFDENDTPTMALGTKSRGGISHLKTRNCALR